MYWSYIYRYNILHFITFCDFFVFIYAITFSDSNIIFKGVIFMQTVGERLAILRDKRNLSQPQLAKELNVATSTIGMWEIGKRGLKDDVIRQLSNYFNVSTDYILNGHQSNFSESDNQVSFLTNNITSSIDDLSQAQLIEILNYIEFVKRRDSRK